MSNLSRSKAALLAAQTVAIIKNGVYVTPDGAQFSIRENVELARQNTRFYAPDWKAPVLPVPRFQTVFGVCNDTTLKVAKTLVEANLKVAALNFASAKNPGGGFLNGARAQEEFLCRNSALFACLPLEPFYALHRAQGGTFYTSSALYSPDVPVFRDEFHELCAPWEIAFLTAAAPNLNGETFAPAQVRAAFDERITRILEIALENGRDALVLGAWGCGAFKNEPQMVAQAFADAFSGQFQNQFARVEFAVLDRSEEKSNFRAFQSVFARFGKRASD